MTRRFLDHDGLNDQTEFFHYDEGKDTVTIETVADVEPVIENNKRLQNDGDGFFPGRNGRRIATIPDNVVLLWMTKYGVNVYDKNHQPAVKRLLNSSDWRYLRTSPGQF